MHVAPHVGTPEQRSQHRWWVPSETAGVGYTVEWLPVERRYRCCCPSFRWGKTRTCRHIQRVAFPKNWRNFGR
jgi:hypothetical protein